MPVPSPLRPEPGPRPGPKVSLASAAGGAESLPQDGHPQPLSLAHTFTACPVSSRQRLHVQPDKERGQRRHLRHRPVGGPHRHHALLPEGAAVLPRLDVRRARQIEPHHQNLDGNHAVPWVQTWCASSEPDRWGVIDTREPIVCAQGQVCAWEATVTLDATPFPSPPEAPSHFPPLLFPSCGKSSQHEL